MSNSGRRGLLFVVSAPSGTGKTTIVERLVQVVPDLSMSRSYTSRPARDGECDGEDYNFITRERFDEMVADGRLPRVGRRLRESLRHRRGRCRPRAVERPGSSCSSSTSRAPEGARQTARHHRDLRVAPVVRGARAPFARPEQGFRRGDPAAAGRRARRRSPPCPNTTTSWSTTSWTRAWTDCGRSCSPSGPASAR